MTPSDHAALAERMFAATLEDFRDAGRRIAGDCIRTPLLKLYGEDGQVGLKCENLQPLGSFKIRAGANALAALSEADLARGVTTASAGNFGQGLCLAARRRGVPVTVHAPDTANPVKLAALERLGAEVRLHCFADWWEIMQTRGAGLGEAVFVHPVCEPEVMLGNGTIGLEIAEQADDFDSVVVPIGGGGLVSGIALALRALGLNKRIVACEVETSTPLAAAFAAGRPVTVERGASWIDGMGSTGVLEPMWPLLRELVDEVVVVETDAVRAALRRLAGEHHLIAEGAGAAAVAAALSPALRGRRPLAVVSGGNIDMATFARLTEEEEAAQDYNPSSSGGASAASGNPRTQQFRHR
jgi:threonine dehydratase